MRKYEFVDDQYPFLGVSHQRKVARGIVMDEWGNVAIHHIYRDDMFCRQWYYETPGGGVDEGETFEVAFNRECEEELGYKVDVICPLCEVHDFYNLIQRENHNVFFLARRSEKVGVHFASKGDQYIKETLYVPIDEAIGLYQRQDDTLVAKLVKQRELPALLLAKEEMRRLGILDERK